jgi:hypothetical protein
MLIKLLYPSPRRSPDHALEQEISERERIEQEMRVARRIQQASLPEEVPSLEDWQISPFYQPAREVGGDFYDFFELEEGRVGVVVGDATGKGIPAALVSEATSNMLRAVAQALGSSSPGEVLERVNQTLLARIPPNMFVTCFYAILNPMSGHLSYANAGHDLPYLRHHNGEAEELRARGMPLGLMPGMGYEEKETMLQAGESVLFYSDGLVEAHDPDGEMFGFPRLSALVAEHAEEEGPPGDYLLEELYSFVGGLGAGGRHHPPYAPTFPVPKLNFLEPREREVRRIPLPRTPVNKGYLRRLRLPRLPRFGYDAKLLHHAQVVHQDATLRPLAIHEAVYDHPLDRHCSAGRRDAQELPLVGAPPGEAAPDFLPFSCLLLDRPLLVGEGGEEHRKYLFEALAPRTLARQRVQFDEVLDGDLVGHGKILLVEDFVDEAVH